MVDYGFFRLLTPTPARARPSRAIEAGSGTTAALVCATKLLIVAAAEPPVQSVQLTKKPKELVGCNVKLPLWLIGPPGSDNTVLSPSLNTPNKSPPGPSTSEVLYAQW